MRHNTRRNPVIKRFNQIPTSFLSDKRFGPPKEFPIRDENHMKYFPSIDNEEDMPFGENDPCQGEM